LWRLFIGNNQALVVLFYFYFLIILIFHRLKQKAMLKHYTDQYAEIWEISSSNLPEFSKSYSSSEKLQREVALDQFLKSIKGFRKKRMKHRVLTENDQDKFFSNTRQFLSEGMDFTSQQLEMMFSDEMITVTRSFVRQAHEFDHSLSFPNIFQACRNVWIMNGLQLIMGIPMQLTPSIFAYSMLYPYTDNMIDDPLISTFEKMMFSNRFRDRLAGNKLKPANKTEQAVFRLVDMIESEYSRIDFPEVYDSLLGIHEAQTNSMMLLQKKHSLTEKETLNICLSKGGASVLADGYLVAGKLTDAQRYFLFGYGAYLQLLDDIQDVDEDYRAGLMTVFSKNAFQSPLDEKLNKTWWFGEEVMKSLEQFDGKQLDLFKSLMRKSMDLFIAEAIAQNPLSYSPKFVSTFENFSPFHFSYIRKRKEQFIPYNGFLLKAIEEIAFSENAILT
jgi:hypothetical protein